MNKLITKARSGVTLVELLVVVLIVTILSVSMLPLLQPFVVEAQYAAEAIPVIGNLRTKIGVYQYDKGKLPYIGSADMNVEEETTVKDEQGNETTTKITKPVSTPRIETWIAVKNANDGSKTADPDADFYSAASAFFTQANPPLPNVQAATTGSSDLKAHLQTACDIDYQDLKGKRSRPNDYQYLVLLNGADYAYFVGCFGDGNGLKKGTGYAVAEIVLKGHKYVGTWKRYKPASDVQLCFTSSTSLDETKTKTLGCYVPEGDYLAGTGATDNGSGGLTVVDTMTKWGWEF